MESIHISNKAVQVYYSTVVDTTAHTKYWKHKGGTRDLEQRNNQCRPHGIAIRLAHALGRVDRRVQNPDNMLHNAPARARAR